MEATKKTPRSSHRHTIVTPRVRTTQSRAEQILRDAEKLRKEDPKRFIEVVQSLSAQAAALTGKDHPLAFLVGMNAHDPFLPELILPAGVYVSEAE